MKKDAYYFPHFCNARHDRKLKRLMKDLGLEGYGIFFMLLEVLREQIDFKFPYQDIDLLADEFCTSTAKLEAVLHKYELFQFDEEQNFFSTKFIFYLQPYVEKTERARAAANKRWDSVKLSIEDKTNCIDANVYANASANAIQMECPSNASAMQGKERKGYIYSAFFESVWCLYPNKKGKACVKETQIKRLSVLGYEVIEKCIERYKNNKPEWQQWQNGSTFFNSGYVDYLDKNYAGNESQEDNLYKEVD